LESAEYFKADSRKKIDALSERLQDVETIKDMSAKKKTALGKEIKAAESQLRKDMERVMNVRCSQYRDEKARASRMITLNDGFQKFQGQCDLKRAQDALSNQELLLDKITQMDGDHHASSVLEVLNEEITLEIKLNKKTVEVFQKMRENLRKKKKQRQTLPPTAVDETLKLQEEVEDQINDWLLDIGATTQTEIEQAAEEKKKIEAVVWVPKNMTVVEDEPPKPEITEPEPKLRLTMPTNRARKTAVFAKGTYGKTMGNLPSFDDIDNDDARSENALSPSMRASTLRTPRKTVGEVVKKSLMIPVFESKDSFTLSALDGQESANISPKRVSVLLSPDLEFDASAQSVATPKRKSSMMPVTLAKRASQFLVDHRKRVSTQVEPGLLDGLMQRSKSVHNVKTGFECSFNEQELAELREELGRADRRENFFDDLWETAAIEEKEKVEDLSTKPHSQMSIDIKTRVANDLFLAFGDLESGSSYCGGSVESSEEDTPLESEKTFVNNAFSRQWSSPTSKHAPRASIELTSNLIQWNVKAKFVLTGNMMDIPVTKSEYSAVIGAYGLDDFRRKEYENKIVEKRVKLMDRQIFVSDSAKILTFLRFILPQDTIYCIRKPLTEQLLYPTLCGEEIIDPLTTNLIPMRAKYGHQKSPHFMARKSKRRRHLSCPRFTYHLEQIEGHLIHNDVDPFENLSTFLEESMEWIQERIDFFSQHEDTEYFVDELTQAISRIHFDYSDEVRGLRNKTGIRKKTMLRRTHFDTSNYRVNRLRHTYVAPLGLSQTELNTEDIVEIQTDDYLSVLQQSVAANRKTKIKEDHSARGRTIYQSDSKNKKSIHDARKTRRTQFGDIVSDEDVDDRKTQIGHRARTMTFKAEDTSNDKTRQTTVDVRGKIRVQSLHTRKSQYNPIDSNEPGIKSVKKQLTGGALQNVMNSGAIIGDTNASRSFKKQLTRGATQNNIDASTMIGEMEKQGADTLRFDELPPQQVSEGVPLSIRDRRRMGARADTVEINNIQMINKKVKKMKKEKIEEEQKRKLILTGMTEAGASTPDHGEGREEERLEKKLEKIRFSQRMTGDKERLLDKLKSGLENAGFSTISFHPRTSDSTRTNSRLSDIDMEPDIPDWLAKLSVDSECKEYDPFSSVWSQSKSGFSGFSGFSGSQFRPPGFPTRELPRMMRPPPLDFEFKEIVPKATAQLSPRQKNLIPVQETPYQEFTVMGALSKAFEFAKNPLKSQRAPEMSPTKIAGRNVVNGR